MVIVLILGVVTCYNLSNYKIMVWIQLIAEKRIQARTAYLILWKKSGALVNSILKPIVFTKIVKVIVYFS